MHPPEFVLWICRHCFVSSFRVHFQNFKIIYVVKLVETVTYVNIGIDLILVNP